MSFNKKEYALSPAELVRDKQLQWQEALVEEELRKLLINLASEVYRNASLGRASVHTQMPNMGAIKARFLVKLQEEIESLGYTFDTYEGNAIRISW